MIVLHLSSASFDSGAGIGVLNLHNAMLANGIDSRIYSSFSLDESASKAVISYSSNLARFIAKFNYWSDRFLMKSLGYNGLTPFSLLASRYTWPSSAELQEADIIHLHWVGNSFLTIK